ncbi:MAG: acetyl-CoA carboxylase biotin carboxylase subunit [Flavobacteriaceae bacterium]|nr:acetyl-CoA carboxylase biotin carboxylase subunit [Flavobacteriaceae bacterium]PHX83518.1 MAG: biotin carboxylase [Flavobacteriales bacterium]
MNKLLVANRGEIAIRVMRSARQMGIKTVAIYSEADRGSAHADFADEAYLVGPAPSAQSYLNAEAILAVCKISGADAVHPGYGFLSENARFAEQVESAGLAWIGPPPSAIRVMGDKLSAKAAAAEFGVPLVLGSDGASPTAAEAQTVADQIGYPVILKASAGGGGKGMRVVHSSSEVIEAFGSASSEALKSFGNGEVFVEKFVSSPRHIEIQVLSDQFGNHLHLFERECSVQRRHQKVVEEAPSTVLTPKLRSAMGEAAVKAAKSCGYVGAGTVEFIFDASGAFYFLEMNTRLQVEHPVTEEVTGLDLVEEQIRIARGEALRYRQEDIKLKGHAIELRVYAEDVSNNFVPDTGTLEVYRRPSGEGIRVDDGVCEGQEVSVYYDPMLAKLIAWGPDRETARLRLIKAIDSYIIVGLKTTLRFGRFVLEHPDFISGRFDTGFVAKNFSPAALQPRPEHAQWAAALAEFYRPEALKNPDLPPSSRWKIRYNP